MLSYWNASLTFTRLVFLARWFLQRVRIRTKYSAVFLIYTWELKFIILFSLPGIYRATKLLYSRLLPPFFSKINASWQTPFRLFPVSFLFLTSIPLCLFLLMWMQVVHFQHQSSNSEQSFRFAWTYFLLKIPERFLLRCVSVPVSDRHR